MNSLPPQPSISIITQARMTSSRLPGKILLEAGGKTMLQHHIDRLTPVHHPIIIATTKNATDDAVSLFAHSTGLPCYRGEEHDVLSRFYEANEHYPADIIVRVTSDCPLIDAQLIQQGINMYLALNDDRCYVSNCFPRTYARGFDFEIFSAAMLREAHLQATSQHDREHVTPFMREHHAKFMHNIAQIANHGALRITLDTPEDFRLLTLLIDTTSALQMNYQDIEKTLLDHPEWVAINAHIEQKKV